MPKLNLQLFLGALIMIRYGECRPPARSCLSRTVSDVGSTNCWCGRHPSFSQGLNYGVHGWVGYFLYEDMNENPRFEAPAISSKPKSIITNRKGQRNFFVSLSLFFCKHIAFVATNANQVICLAIARRDMIADR
jgi:hypothetical protein